LLDTSVLIDAARGIESVAARVRSLPVRPLASAISIDELRVGMRPGEEDVTLGLLEWITVVAVSREEALISGTWRRDFAARGITLSQSDTLIAACALTAQAVVATGNVRHFPMPELVVEHWPSG
jgi:predicted nucleic acid-binding protein